MIGSKRRFEKVSVRGANAIGRDSVLVMVVGLSAVLPFLLAPLRAQILGPSGRGEFAFFQSSFTIIGVASAMGVRYACYQVGFLDVHRFSISYLRMGFVSIVSASVIMIPLSFVAAASFPPLIFWAIVGSVILAPSYVINQVEFANANHQQMRLRIGSAAAMPPILEFVATLAAFVNQRYNLFAAVVTAVGAQAMRLLTAWIWHLRDRRRLFGQRQRAAPRKDIALFKASLKNAPASVTPLLSGNLDIIIFGMFTTSDVLGRYAVAKLGFSAVLITATLLEGRALAIARVHGKVKSLCIVVGVASSISLICGTVGWYLTPILFGEAFIASAHAFPVLATAGCLAFIFVCCSAMNAQQKRASAAPGTVLMGVLLVSCLGFGVLLGNDVYVISFALVLAQAAGVAVVLAQYFSKDRKASDGSSSHHVHSASTA